ncbi:MAG: hypothetical protein JW861_01670 [Bacteroidales bacterium]|nr:hypothetical protein [Bacteroidales bacterium]
MKARGTIFLLILTLSLTSWAKEENYSKKISKSFNVNSNATLMMQTSFGTVNCTHWDNNVITIDAEISVDARTPEKAENFFDQVNVTFSGSPDLVKVVSSFEGRSGNNYDEFSIDFTVKYPKSVKLDLEHKFGELFITECDGSADIEVGYGSLRAERLNHPDNKLNISFSDNCNIGYVQSGDIVIKYSELKIDETVTLLVDSKFSDLEVVRADKVEIDSGYDESSFGSVREVIVDGNFSDFSLGKLAETLYADMQYGEITVNEIFPGFIRAEVKSRFSDAELIFSPDASFSIDAEIKFGDFSYPQGSRITVEETSLTTSRYEGSVGVKSAASARVIIRASNSDVNLSLR